MCHHEIGQYELEPERRREATSRDADEPEPEESPVAPADD
jgi:hypothetical protein